MKAIKPILKARAAVLALLLGGLPTACMQQKQPRNEERHFNVLFLFADDMRFNTIHALNNPEIQTPNLDALSRRSAVFQNAYILGGQSAAICAPSRAMLMTGRELFQVHPTGARIDDSLVTMPQLFGENAYRTFGTGKWHNGKGAYARSFSNGGSIMFGGMTTSQYDLPLFDYDTSGLYPDSARRRIQGTQSSTVYADEAIRFLEQYQGEAPFFMYVSFQAPHDPREAPQAFLSAYDTSEIALPPNFISRHPFDNGELNVRDELLAGFPREPDEIKKHIRDYYAMISHMDHEIGRIIEALKASGKYENTVIVFSADNGLAVGQHGLMGKQNLYEHSIKVPLMMAGPGIRPGHLNELVCLSDIFPSLAALAGLEVPPSVKGESFRDLLDGSGEGGRSVLYYAYKNFQRAYRKDNWKLICYQVKGQVREQLFNLEKDPWEMNDLSAERVDLVAELKAELQEVLRQAGDSVRFDAAGWGVPEIPAWSN